VDIAGWTLQAFGSRQAAVYEEDLIVRCNEIASGVARSYDCGVLADLEATETLRFARAGQHFILFVEEDERVIIIDFLHARSDLPKRLAMLQDPLSS
jgi:plasmid stabilization system protein ParE